ncbi:MAG: hypothetical protein GX638_07260 [Crenarchaeota archaeon]|nr:hypothetical protein [Thermoproteota archaeon]
MNINWKKIYNDPIISLKYKDLKHKKDSIYDMIIGELNRISVSDTIEEKESLFTFLKDNIDRYYNLCVDCTNFLNSFSE